ncbi:tape measure protein [Cyclobacterium marinum]|uniref:Tape measure protein N-terminal domain-containing protein n=1 Tax=Cyclobacterium marinum (strain ATCC 25205 / DSM 745 / LMG 13164 / NCIMB 1802) TaxID=880070 RepID=G0IY25_CYCMS|nr:tape measure protein [Cyclobacterium marinum]AEL24358.1 hypothetical protein Cycma_0583 [Cyclobacterium marinum DSM 745]
MANIPLRADIDNRSFESVKKYLDEIARKAGMSEKEIDDMNKSIENSGKKSNEASKKAKGGLDDLNKTAKSVGAAMLAAFSVQAVIALGNQVVNVTAKFQKMEAMLRVALGSQSDATRAMEMISDFAGKTPFQVEELTQSFVKLTNQGFKPTRDQLRQMGDLAASMGKDFDQLTEAILDAQTGEFERLKEFGIRASSEGDRVRFTFKGVTTEVQKTDEAMRGYILSLGDAAGISGAMAEVSATVGGQLSNLSDNWTMLMKEIGDGTGGVISYAIGELNTLVTTLRNFGAFAEGLNPFKSVQDWSFETKKALLDLGMTNSGKLISDLLEPIDKIDFTKLEEGSTAYMEFLRIFEQEGEDIKEVQGLWETYVEVRKNDYYSTLADAGRAYFEAEGKARRAQVEADEEARKQAEEALAVQRAKVQAEQDRINGLGLIAKLEHDITEAQKERSQAGSVAEVSRIDARIEKLQKELALVNMLANGIDTGNRDPFEGLEESTTATFEKVNEAAKNGLDKFVDQYKEANEKAKKSDEDLARHKEEVMKGGISTALTVASGIADINYFASQERIAQLEAEKEASLALAGDDVQQREVLEKQYNEKIRAEKVKQAKFDKAASLFEIGLNAAIGISKAIAASPVTFGLPFSAFVAAQAAVQAAVVLAKPLPKYKDGVFDLDGPGTSTSDSITARLSKGESVVHAKGTEKFKDILKPIIEDKNFTYEKLLGIALDKVPLKLRGDVMNPPIKDKSGTDTALLKGLYRLEKAYKNKKETVITIDRNGVSQRERSRSRVIKQQREWLYD